MEKKLSVAIVGLGIIGSRCVDNLLKADYSLVCWNRTSGKHPQQADDLLKVAEQDVISLYLKDGEACKDIFTRLKPNLRAGQIILNHATVDLDSTNWLNDACSEIGIEFLDCPFTGSKDAAAGGNLIYYAGGSKETLAKVNTLLEATSKEIQHIGEVGSATIVKLATNLISASSVQALSEALAITSAYSIEPNTLINAVASNACGSMVAKLKLPNMAQGEYDPHFSLDNMLKDSKFAIQAAKQKNITTPGIETTSSIMQKLSDQGNGNLDFSSLHKQFS